VIDTNNPSHFLKSSAPYSTLVSGIYSTKPGVADRRQTSDKDLAEIPMALIGIVPTKVSAENGAVATGDPLVTSSTPGFAMKATDHDRITGAVVGKALGPLASGRGLIGVLVSLSSSRNLREAQTLSATAVTVVTWRGGIISLQDERRSN